MLPAGVQHIIGDRRAARSPETMGSAGVKVSRPGSRLRRDTRRHRRSATWAEMDRLRARKFRPFEGSCAADIALIDRGFAADRVLAYTTL